MGLVAFDTLKFANQIQAGNFTPERAQVMTTAMVEAMAGVGLATKSDLVAVRGDIAAVKAELKADIVTLDQRMTAGFRDVEREMTIKLGVMMMAMAGLIVAANQISVARV